MSPKAGGGLVEARRRQDAKVGREEWMVCSGWSIFKMRWPKKRILERDGRSVAASSRSCLPILATLRPRAQTNVDQPVACLAAKAPAGFSISASGPDRRSEFFDPKARSKRRARIWNLERKVRTPPGRIPGKKRRRADLVARKGAGRIRFRSSRGAAGHIPHRRTVSQRTSSRRMLQSGRRS